MERGIRSTAFFLLVVSGLAPAPAPAIETSSPQSATLYVYDVGFTLVNELRRVNLARGDNEVVIRQLPAKLDPTTAAISLVAGGPRIDIKEQRFEFDLADPNALFQRYLGKTVIVHSADGAASGTLMSAPVAALDGRPEAPLGLGMPDDGTIRFFSPESIHDVAFPQAMKNAFTEPTLIWHATAAQDGLQNVRVSYATDGLKWSATYEVILQPDGGTAHFSSRVSLENDSGGRFENARVKLISTEKGSAAPVLSVSERHDRMEGQPPPMRYAYGADEPSIERTVSGIAPVETYELPQSLTIEPGQTRYFQFALQDKLPVTRFYVYDGVKFDRFQRNRRNDWNYGTEYHTTVETQLEFNNTKDAGLGVDLPMGFLRVYQQKDDGTVDFLGEDTVRASPAGKTGTVLLGPARGLQGERERTGYTEVKPLHQYEETFEIRLSNVSDDTAEIRVIEHLYRWVDYEIVKADAEYTTTAPQTIEFRPVVKPGGKAAIHYTVRYSW